MVESLVAKSLLSRRDDPDGEPRFYMLETIREYAAEKLDAESEAEQVRQRHARFYAGLVQGEGPAWGTVESPEFDDRIKLDHDNLRVALTFALERREADLAVAIGKGICGFWVRYGYMEEGRDRLVAIMSLAGAERRPGAGWVLLGAGLVTHGKVPAEAEALHERSLEAFRRAGDVRGMGAALLNLASEVSLRGEHERGLRLTQESVELLRSVGEDRFLGYALTGLSWLRCDEGELEEAESLTREAVSLFEGLGDPAGAAIARTTLGEALLRFGDRKRAQPLFREVLATRTDVGLGATTAAALDGLAIIAGLDGEADRFARLWGASQSRLDGMGAALDTALDKQRATALDSAREALGDEEFEQLLAEGRAMSLDEAIAYALEDEAG